VTTSAIGKKDAQKKLCCCNCRCRIVIASKIKEEEEEMCKKKESRNAIEEASVVVAIFDKSP
jgi:hypothetical protein